MRIVVVLLLASAAVRANNACDEYTSCKSCLSHQAGAVCGWCELTLSCMPYNASDPKNNACWRLPVPSEAVEVIHHSSQCSGAEGPLLFEAQYGDGGGGGTNTTPSFPTTGLDRTMLIKGEHMGPFARRTDKDPWQITAGPFNCSLDYQTNVTLEDKHGYYNQVHESGHPSANSACVVLFLSCRHEKPP